MPVESRVPPCSEELEQCVLGALLLDFAQFISVKDVISPAGFYVPSHRVIFSAMSTLHSQGLMVDSKVLVDFLESQSLLSQAGGRNYIWALEACVPDSSRVLVHAERLRALQQRRELISVCQEIQLSAYEEEDTARLLELAENKIIRLSSNRGRVSSVQSAVSSFLDGFSVSGDPQGEFVFSRPLAFSYLPFVGLQRFLLVGETRA